MALRIKTTCPSCNQTLKVNEDLIGKTARCPACQHRFVIASVASLTEQSIESSVEAIQTRADIDSKPNSDERPAKTASTAKAEPSLGKIGRFELKAVLGQGGFGKVYRAYDPVLDRQVALKVPTFESHETQKIKRFLAEGKAAAKLHHPNIVAVFETGEVDGQYYIASEYIEGVPLSVKIKQDRPNLVRSVEIVRALAEALQYAHDEGVIHRDIKPANIMIGTTGRPQIMDFGLAKRMDEDSTMTSDGSVLGTPAYMSPEQAQGDRDSVGPASDQYSLGVVLYELLTGQRPFDGPPQSVIQKVLTEDPLPPRTVVKEVPKDIDAICQKAMAKVPAARYVKVGLLANDLQSWIAGTEIQARPLRVIWRLGRSVARSPRMASLAVCLMQVIPLLAILFLLYFIIPDLRRSLQAFNDTPWGSYNLPQWFHTLVGVMPEVSLGLVVLGALLLSVEHLALTRLFRSSRSQMIGVMASGGITGTILIGLVLCVFVSVVPIRLLISLASRAIERPVQKDASVDDVAGILKLNGVGVREARGVDAVVAASAERQAVTAALRILPRGAAPRRLTLDHTAWGGDEDYHAFFRRLEGAGQLGSIEHLSLRFTDLSNVTFVRDMRLLRTLVLDYTQIGDDIRLSAIQSPFSLETLSVVGTDTGDYLPSLLGSMRSLRELDMSATLVTDTGVSRLAALNLGIERLSLRDTKVSDASVGNLLQMTKLRELNLDHTLITPNGIAQLQDGLPNCKITFKN